MYGLEQNYLQNSGGVHSFGTLYTTLSSMRQWKAPNYHLSANPTERSNRVIGTMISSYIKENLREWDVNIPQVPFAFNTAVHEVTEFAPAI